MPSGFGKTNIMKNIITHKSIEDHEDSIDNLKCRLITLNWEVRNYKDQPEYIKSMKEMIKDTKKDIAEHELKIKELKGV